MADADYTYDSSPALVPAADERGEGMWRWRRLLPLDGADVFPLPVGGTPLVAPPRLRAALDLPGLVLKDETRSFSGSNKDRATALCLADAVRRGAPAVVAASSGNLAVSCAAGAAAVGIPAHLFVSTHTVSPHKVALMRAYGATVWRVDGPYEEFAVDGGEARGGEQLVARAGRHVEGAGEQQDHLAAGLGAAGLHEGEMPRRDLGLHGEPELAEPPALPPLAKQRAEGAEPREAGGRGDARGRGACGRRGSVAWAESTPRAERET